MPHDDLIHRIFNEDQSKETYIKIEEEKEQVGETQSEIDEEIKLIQISSEENTLRKWQAF